MKIKSVHIGGFGPFHNTTLHRGKGMTVIVGNNESGKSSWHAGVYAALCGMRQARGAPSKEDREFTAQYRPWGGGAWSVKAEVELADGRLIEITQDLDGADRRAVDLGIGRRDVSSEIIVDGSPDASRWLGLDRSAFRATACVRQSEILDVTDRADALQEHLQRAVATAADETAANAVNRLDEFHRERVGTLHPNSQRPLRASQLALEKIKVALEAARREHEHYLGKRQAVQRLSAETSKAEERYRLLTAAHATRLADHAERTAQKAQSLITLLESDPIDIDALQSALDQVSQAMAVWKSAPALEPWTGRTSAEINRELAALPTLPGTDLILHHTVLEAERAWLGAKTALAAHENERRRPTDVAPPRPSVPFLITAAAVAAVGAGIGFLTTHVVTVLALLIAAGLAAFAVRHAMLARLRARAAEETWTTTHSKYQQTLREKVTDFRHALAERGLKDTADPEQAVRLYREGCEVRAGLGKLEAELGRALLLEGNRANRKKVQEDLLRAARNQGLNAADAESAIKALVEWQEANRDRLNRQRHARAELKSLLNGRPAKQLFDEAVLARQSADTLSIGLDAIELTSEVSTAGLEQRISEAQDQERRVIKQKASAEGELKTFQAPDVSSCEEAVTAALADWDRIQRLDTILKKTREFLERAQDRVHREFAPHLENIIREWLPRVTAGRYVDAAIDPQTLTLQVKDVQGNWRKAELLSQGTAEQIYLLLRVAVIRFLTKSSESSPVIFDDVTTQSDSTRTEAILELLHEISREQQVIMFSQEDHVRRWSESHLSSSRDKLVPLETPLPIQSAATKLDASNDVHN